MTHGYAITLYVPDHATREQVEHIQQTLQIAIDKLPDRAFIIVDVPKHIPGGVMGVDPHATRSRAADCPRCGKPNEGRHPITDDKPDICGLVIGGRVCMLPASGNATPDRAAEQTIEKLRNALLDLCDLHHRTLTAQEASDE